MKIKDMSIADLKAAYDFVLIDLIELKKYAEKKGISVKLVPAYPEVEKIEDILYNELVNRTRLLE